MRYRVKTNWSRHAQDGRFSLAVSCAFAIGGFSGLQPRLAKL
jgi:hypothetical protein